MGALRRVVEVDGKLVVGAVTVPRLERAAHSLRLRLDEAANTLADYEGQIAPIREAFAPVIRRHGAEIVSAKLELERLLKAAEPRLFGKLKSKVLHGIKLGWRKVADAWSWPADDALVDLIREKCSPEEQKAYLVTTTVGRKDAIPEAVRIDLGIGCTRGTNAVFVSETAPSTGAALLALLAQLPEEAP